MKKLLFVFALTLISTITFAQVEDPILGGVDPCELFDDWENGIVNPNVTVTVTSNGCPDVPLIPHGNARELGYTTVTILGAEYRIFDMERTYRYCDQYTCRNQCVKSYQMWFRMN